MYSITNSLRCFTFSLYLHHLTILMVTAEQKRFYEILGGRIKAARRKAGLKQEVFASHLQLSRASIVNVEKGRQHPTIHTLCVIAKVLDTDISELLPPTLSNDKLSPEWKKLVKKELKSDSQSTDKILGFIKEIKSQTNS